MQVGHLLHIGQGTTGDYNLSGGTLMVYRGGNSLMGASYGPSISIGPGSGAGTLSISGGELTTRVGVESSATGVFEVMGSGATQIGIGANGSVDGNGASAEVESLDGSLIDVGFVDGNAVNGRKSGPKDGDGI